MQGRQAFVLGAELLIKAFNVRHIKATLGTSLQVLISTDGRIQLLQDATVVNQHAVAFCVMQAIDPCHGLNQVMTFKGFVDVQHRITGFIKASQQLVNHDQQVGGTVHTKVVNDLLLVVLGVCTMGGHVLLPPLLHFRHGVFVHV